jgi:hypothetical protein
LFDDSRCIKEHAEIDEELERLREALEVEKNETIFDAFNDLPDDETFEKLAEFKRCADKLLDNDPFCEADSSHVTYAILLPPHNGTENVVYIGETGNPKKRRKAHRFNYKNSPATYMEGKVQGKRCVSVEILPGHSVKFCKIVETLLIASFGNFIALINLLNLFAGHPEGPLGNSQIGLHCGDLQLSDPEIRKALAYIFARGLAEGKRSEIKFC